MNGAGAIGDIRRSLGFSAEDEELLGRSAPHLLPEIDGWVDAFYARLLTDPAAMALLCDEARVIRLKRSLAAWFRELFALPVDEDYERMRAGIGRTHVRIGMPQYLMVTAMTGVREDVASSVRRIYGDAPEAEDVRRAVQKVLDLELALMLGAYRRRSQEVRQLADRAVYAERLVHRVARSTDAGVSAALCYVELVRRTEDRTRREHWMRRLEAVLHDVGTVGARAGIERRTDGSAVDEVEVADACSRALANVSLPEKTSVTLDVPPGLRAPLHARPFELAVEELVQNAANHDPGGIVAMKVALEDERTLSLTVTDSGPGWPLGVRDVADTYALGSGMGLAYAEYVAGLHDGSVELFQAPGGGAGVRLRLGLVAEPGEPGADLAAHSA
ncbi:MAG: protoglobin domain-containing protein [Planctomycetota bacterium]